MHLHGFYFDVDSLGDGSRHVVRRRGAAAVVTQLMQPGATMAMTWTPERVGNWLFHCHMMHTSRPSESWDAAGRSRGIMPVMTRRQGWRG